MPNIVGQTIGAIAAAGEQGSQALQARRGPDQTATTVLRDLISADTSQVELLPPIDPNQPLQQTSDYQAAGSSGGAGYTASAIPALPADAATYLNGPGTFSSSAQEVTVNPSRQLVPDGKYGGAFTLSSTNPNGIAVSFAADPSGAGLRGHNPWKSGCRPGLSLLVVRGRRLSRRNRSEFPLRRTQCRRRLRAFHQK